MNMDFKKGNKQQNGFFKSSEKVLWRGCFFLGSSSGWVSVSAGRLIVTENTELFLKNSLAGVNN